MIITVYILLPMVNITIQLYEIGYPALDLRLSFFESWLCFYMSVCISRIAEYFISIRPTWIIDARSFME